MECIIEPGAFDPNHAWYFSEVSTDFPCATIQRAQILEPQGRAVQPPALRSTFNINAHGFFILFNGRLGSISPIASTHIDYVYCVSQHSVFGYAYYPYQAKHSDDLSETFGLCDGIASVIPQGHLGIELPQPDLPIQCPNWPTFWLHQPWIDAHQIPNLGMLDVIDVLLDNCILPELMDHAYAFRLAYLEAHHSDHPIHRALYDEIDNEQLACVQAYGALPPIAAWDGWRHPSKGDVTCLHTIMETAEDCPCPLQ